jgi:hypothetical protein
METSAAISSIKALSILYQVLGKRLNAFQTVLQVNRIFHKPEKPLRSCQKSSSFMQWLKTSGALVMGYFHGNNILERPLGVAVTWAMQGWLDGFCSAEKDWHWCNLTPPVPGSVSVCYLLLHLACVGPEQRACWSPKTRMVHWSVRIWQRIAAVWTWWVTCSQEGHSQRLEAENISSSLETSIYYLCTFLSPF